MDYIKLHVSQADIIFKALRYVAKNEGLSVSDDLESVFEVLAEYNPAETNVSDTVDVMEYLKDFIKDNNRYAEYFEEDQDED